MPMSYDPKTGVPSFNPFENELDEGVTPEAKLPELKGLIHKLDPFKGDPPPGVDKIEMKYVDPGPYVPPDERGVVPVPRVKLSKAEAKKRFPKPKQGEDTIKIMRPPSIPTMPPVTTIEHMADEMLNDVVRKARPAKLDNTFTTDEELQDLARQVEDRTIENWPMLRRLLNRLLRAEGK